MLCENNEMTNEMTNEMKFGVYKMFLLVVLMYIID